MQRPIQKRRTQGFLRRTVFLVGTAYVEEGSGDLYWIPKEALIKGGSPIVVKESRGASRLMQVSRDPFVTTLEARLRCAQHNIEPNF